VVALLVSIVVQVACEHLLLCNDVFEGDELGLVLVLVVVEATR